jgi:excisionase family DNA binding protein
MCRNYIAGCSFGNGRRVPETRHMREIQRSAKLVLMTHDRLLSPGEAATILEVSPQTVRRLADSGRLASVKTPGGTRRYPKTEVQALRQRRIASFLAA